MIEITWEEANTLLLLLVSLQALFATWESRRLGARLEEWQNRDNELKTKINEQLDKPEPERTGFVWEGNHYTITGTRETAVKVEQE